jgi:hypothetical protein
LKFEPGPDYGEFEGGSGRRRIVIEIDGRGELIYLFCMESVWCWGWDGAGDLDGPDGRFTFPKLQ